ncbi:TetR/AcrR family transcriptional regulator [Streptomyces caatingaensis]|uniref:TetR family transcriptional regulator n=1 Tax=Streptomyces caatingaensis TaxID=1678637 RepID=A0A0K9XF31_9ACTN|nr:TetR/AcrR family transcriptional regulator [Streptomyces caatingaensis]KNB51848.1 TetR family transcriptional regulator [Streptomyces caatingaensis]
MPAARELLLDAAFTALGTRPWHGVRMVDVAAAAGVSRQTLYNEFGSKDGLARALVRREADAFLAGVDRSLADVAGRGDADAGDCCAAAVVWTLRAARANPLVRAALTGCRGERLPAQAAPAVPAPRTPPVPAAARGAPVPAALVERIRDGAAEAAGRTREGAAAEPEALLGACEAAVRLALSYVVAPAGSDAEAAERVARVVRALLDAPVRRSGPQCAEPES